MPWRRRVRNTTERLPDLPDGGIGDDPVSMVVALLLLAVLLPFLLLMLVAGVEMLLMVLAMPLAVAWRMLFAKDWVIEVRCGWTPHAAVRAGDWQGSRLRMQELAQSIERGQAPAALDSMEL